MISPLVRRRRLAIELRNLRGRSGYSASALAAKSGVARQRISALENAHVAPDLDQLARLLDVFDIESGARESLMVIAREARVRGWWSRYSDEMGRRQAGYANLEAGACEIHEYQMTFLPGLLQLPAYTEARTQLERPRAANYDPARAIEARASRQRAVRRSGGPTYEVIIDEVAVRRPAVPVGVFADQLDHMVALPSEWSKLTIRILPLTPSTAIRAVPRSAFAWYRYPDPEDPVVVAVDTVTDDLILTEEGVVATYLDLYDALRSAAWSPSESLDFLIEIGQQARRAVHEG
ncbi:transcriptional regulator [Catellatospora sp. IY07-71]|uniref:helix-turn-helix domain-containing protein n=1 Tax=Catellatospora sp. IY07-71 TaxID=2728827 RepID=UPI001BB3C1D6|nr:helix-turn-helix transcriptional regulator [Catellatospora sp. IY07-71]BCJ70694.1 transcriptional regulator [Catellatospora sp. IY07-71]